jgi:hypothetical protein
MHNSQQRALSASLLLMVRADWALQLSSCSLQQQVQYRCWEAGPPLPAPVVAGSDAMCHGLSGSQRNPILSEMCAGHTHTVQTVLTRVVTVHVLCEWTASCAMYGIAGITIVSQISPAVTRHGQGMTWHDMAWTRHDMACYADVSI